MLNIQIETRGFMEARPRVTWKVSPLLKALCILLAVYERPTGECAQEGGRTDIKDSLSLLEYYKLKEKCKQ